MKRLLAALLLVAMASASFAASLKPLSAGRAPALAIPLLGGQKADMNQLRGQVVLISFWATWCPPCRKEMPSMDRLSKMYVRQPFTVLAVNVGEPADVVERFLDDVPVSFAIGLDEDSTRARAWKAFVYPTSFLVDKTGRIRFGLNGAIEWDSPEVVEIIEQLLLE
jgi:thiol-disulfide isomerase/thioredoxin